MNRRKLIATGLALSASVPFVGAAQSQDRVQDITKIKVDVDRQKLFAFANDRQIISIDCVTGRPSKHTEAGRFRIYRKVKNHVSTKYGSPMPYAMFFQTDGKAIHAADYVFTRSYAKWMGLDPEVFPTGTYGCVGISLENAKALYGRTKINTVVEIA